MPGMPIKADPALRAAHGSFGARVEDGELRLPPEVYRLAKGWRVETAEDFFAAVTHLPGITGIAFGWPREVSLGAIDELAAQLRGHVLDVVLDPAVRAEPRTDRPSGVSTTAPAGGATPQDYADVFGEIEAKTAPQEPKREEHTVIIDGAPPTDGFEE